MLVLRKLEYSSPVTTRSDAERRRGKALLLLGYLPAVLLLVMMLWYFITLANSI